MRILSSYRVAALGLVAAAALLVSPGPANAATVAGVGSDAQDQAPSLAGSPLPDISSVHIDFDATAGAVRADISFYNPVSTSDPESYNVTLGAPEAIGSLNTCTSDVSIVGDLAGTASPSLLVTGYTDAASGKVVWSADRRTLSVYAANAALAGRNEACVDANTYLYDSVGHCGDTDCDFISHIFDGDDIDAFASAPSTETVVDPTLFDVARGHTAARIHAAVAAYSAALKKAGPAISRCTTTSCALSHVIAFRRGPLRTLRAFVTADVGARAQCGSGARKAVTDLSVADHAWASLQVGYRLRGRDRSSGASPTRPDSTRVKPASLRRRTAPLRERSLVGLPERVCDYDCPAGRRCHDDHTGGPRNSGDDHGVATGRRYGLVPRRHVLVLNPPLRIVLVAWRRRGVLQLTDPFAPARARRKALGYVAGGGIEASSRRAAICTEGIRGFDRAAVAFDVRNRETVFAHRPSPRGAGWLHRHYSIRGRDGEWTAAIENWLAEEGDAAIPASSSCVPEVTVFAP